MIPALVAATLYLHSLPEYGSTTWPTCPICHEQGQCAGIQWTRTHATLVECYAEQKHRIDDYAFFAWRGYDRHPPEPDRSMTPWKCHEEQTIIEKRQIVWICPKRHLWIEDFPVGE